MVEADDAPGPTDGAPSGPLLARPVAVQLPTWLVDRLPASEVSVPVRGHREVARAVRTIVPVALAVVGAILAVAGAIAAERPATEGVGTLATELGAALLFAGGVVVVVGRVPTVGRIIALVAVALLGAAAIAAALTFGWEGAALALAMELGVAAVVLLVVDVVLLGLVFPRVEGLAVGPERAVVTLRLGAAPPEAERGDEPRS